MAKAKVSFNFGANRKRKATKGRKAGGKSNAWAKYAGKKR